MSDETQSNQQAPAGQPDPSPNGGAPAGQQQYLTRDEALTLVREELKKTSQSITDRVSAKVQQVIQAAAAKGVTMTVDQAQAVVDAATAPEQKAGKPNASAASQQQPAAQHAASQGQPPAPGGSANLAADIDPVTAHAVKILKGEFGLDIDPNNLDENDDATKLIDMQTDDPEKFYASIRAYGKAKKEAAASGDPAALPGLASGGQPAARKPYEGMRGTDILNQAYRKTT